MSGILLSSTATPHLSKQSLSLDLELGDCASLAPQGGHCTWLLQGAAHPNSSPHAFRESTLSTELPRPQPSTLTSSSHPSPEDCCPTFPKSNFPRLLWHATIFPIHYHLKYAHVNVIFCLFPHPLSTLHAFSVHHSY